MLVGRVAEVHVLRRLLSAIRDGLSGVLVLRGEAGIGKTALLDWAVDQAADMQVTRMVGIESEMDLGFAGLHQLLIPFLGGLDRLPAPQRDALSSAFGLVAGPAPDRFLVGLAALTLVTDAAAERPVLCVVDDAQWLDRVSVEVLGFVARRLFADRVGILFAVREEEQRAVPLTGLPELVVGALPDEAAGELLAGTVGGPLDQQVGRRVVAETAGNPLALVEFGSELTAEEASGLVPLAEPLRFGGRLEELYRSRVRALPEQAQMLLLVVAADQLREPGKIWRAAGQLGIDPEVAELPAVERLVIWTPAVHFRHPLMRSAVYYGASRPGRRRAHEALAAASDPERDPDRRAWHLAAAAPGPDEQVAAELERSAARARGRGGWTSGATFLERAAELTPDQGRRAQRLLEAARARFVAGEAPVARALLHHAASHLEDPLARAKARRLEGLTLYAAGDLPEATSVLLDAAKMMESYNPRLARDTLLDAYGVARYSGQFGVPAAEVLEAIRSAPRVEQSKQTVVDLLLDGFAAWGDRRYEACAEFLRQAVAPLTADQPLPDDVVRSFTAMSLAASRLYDWSARQALDRHWVADLRRRGALSAMLVALVFQANNQVLEGRFADVGVTVAEGRTLSEAMDFRAHLGLFATAELTVLAWRGREAEARALAAQLLEDFAAQGHGLGTTQVHMALAWLEIGLGNYPEALRAAVTAHKYRNMAALDVVEAGARCGDHETATAALAAFAPLALAMESPITLGLLALGRALLADDEAEPEYLLAIEHLRQCPLAPYLARSHLLYGEWLRRQRRRRDARDQLRTAWQMFDKLDMEAFSERARAELRATGESARKRSVPAQDALTAQEAQIARMAADGASNGEIAARLFISASTVEYHLRKVFRKLGITSRVRLAHSLEEQEEETVPPG